jgi:hypothetical protein
VKSSFFLIFVGALAVACSHHKIDSSVSTVVSEKNISAKVDFLEKTLAEIVRFPINFFGCFRESRG